MSNKSSYQPKSHVQSLSCNNKQLQKMSAAERVLVLHWHSLLSRTFPLDSSTMQVILLSSYVQYLGTSIAIFPEHFKQLRLGVFESLFLTIFSINFNHLLSCAKLKDTVIYCQLTKILASVCTNKCLNRGLRDS